MYFFAFKNLGIVQSSIKIGITRICLSLFSSQIDDSHSVLTQLEATEFLDNKINKKSLLSIPFSISAGIDCPPQYPIRPATERTLRFLNPYIKYSHSLYLEKNEK